MPEPMPPRANGPAPKKPVTDDGELRVDLDNPKSKPKGRPSRWQLRRNGLRLLAIGIPVAMITIVLALWILSSTGAIQPGSILCNIGNCPAAPSPAPTPSPTLASTPNLTATVKAQGFQTFVAIATSTAQTVQAIQAQRLTANALTPNPEVPKLTPHA